MFLRPAFQGLRVKRGKQESEVSPILALQGLNLHHASPAYLAVPSSWKYVVIDFVLNAPSVIDRLCIIWEHT